MEASKPQYIKAFLPMIQDAYILDEDTAAVILSAVIAAVMGPSVLLKTHHCGELPVTLNILATEPKGLPRYQPIVEHLLSGIYNAQLDKVRERQLLSPETLSMFHAVQCHHETKAEERLAEAKYNDYSPKPRPRGFEAQTVESIRAKKTLDDQREKNAASLLRIRPVVLAREISPEALSAWRTLSLDRCVQIYGKGVRVLEDLEKAKNKDRSRIIKMLTAHPEERLLTYANDRNTAEVPVSLSHFLTIPLPGTDGRCFPELSLDMEAVAHASWTLPPLDPVLVSPGKFDVEANGYNIFILQRLVERIRKKNYIVRVSDEAWRVHQSMQMQILERLEAVKHPLMRGSLSSAPLNTLKISALWGVGYPVQTISAQTYEYVWSMIGRLLDRLEAHLRDCPEQAGPNLSPEARTMVDKLSSKGGSLTFRELARCYSKMSRAQLDPLVAEASSAGLVLVEGRSISLLNPARQQKDFVSGVGGVSGRKDFSPAMPTQNHRIEDRQNEDR